MKVTFRLPSKAIQYGYAEVEFEVPEETGGGEIGASYAQFTYHFLKGEQAGMEAVLAGHKDPVDQAVETITESIPVTVVDETEAPDGAVAEAAAKKPWEQKVAPKAKPWETGGAAPKAAPALDW